MSVHDDAIDVLVAWYCELPRYADKLPSKGSISAALVVLQRLRSDFNLSIDAHVAGGQSQIAGLSAGSLANILKEFGETRPLTAIGGRSNRGARGDASSLLDSMRSLKLEALTDDSRDETLRAMQCHIVSEYVALYHELKRVRATFDQSATTTSFISNILDNAQENGKAGAVAEYLVGAKLALIFPDKEVRNKRFSTSDSQTGHEGDFQIGDTAFHITIAPMPELFQKMKGNVERGLRVYLLVPESEVVGARQNARLQIPGKVAVEAIESFVATNIDELTEFESGNLKSGCRRLLDAYNVRVAEIELDQSLLIEIPRNLH